jgi:aminoglycoside phosphotransferase family enzyme
MRRLPAERMLDRVIESGEPSSAELYRVSRLLISFYRSVPRRRLAPESFILRLRREVALNRLDLINPRRSPSPGLARSLCACHLRFIDLHLPLLRKRAARICEAHGDLRPEHLCLEPQPIAIDRLEFEPAFRLLDPVDELSYLAMECERLGSERVGTRLLDDYMAGLGDRVPEPLIAFYKGVRACQRARLAVLHLHGNSRAAIREHWLGRALAYLNLAARYVGAVSSIRAFSARSNGEPRCGAGGRVQDAPIGLARRSNFVGISTR